MRYHNAVSDYNVVMTFRFNNNTGNNNNHNICNRRRGPRVWTGAGLRRWFRITCSGTFIRSFTVLCDDAYYFA